jgi:hypothetical protein
MKPLYCELQRQGEGYHPAALTMCRPRDYGDARRLIPAPKQAIATAGRTPAAVVGDRGSALPPTTRPWLTSVSDISACNAQAQQHPKRTRTATLAAAAINWPTGQGLARFGQPTIHIEQRIARRHLLASNLKGLALVLLVVLLVVGFGFLRGLGNQLGRVLGCDQSVR